MKRILWISRHEMTPEQHSDLERVMGDDVSLDVWKDTLSDVERLRPMIKNADAVAAVLPPEMYADLLRIAGGKPVLRSVAGRIPTGCIRTLEDGRQEQEFAFTHRCWQQILRAEFVTKTL